MRTVVAVKIEKQKKRKTKKAHSYRKCGESFVGAKEERVWPGGGGGG